MFNIKRQSPDIATDVSLCYTACKALLTTVGGRFPILPPRYIQRGEVIGMGTYEFLTTLVLLLALIIAIKS